NVEVDFFFLSFLLTSFLVCSFNSVDEFKEVERERAQSFAAASAAFRFSRCFRDLSAAFRRSSRNITSNNVTAHDACSHVKPRPISVLINVIGSNFTLHLSLLGTP